MNSLYYGDNLDILKKNIKAESIDLIYLDPPFQSGKNYNQIFQPQAGGIKGATAQIQAFQDTWQWGPEAESEYTGLITGTLTTEPPGQKLKDLMIAMRGYLTEGPLLAYLCMMAPRLVEMRRALKDTGSIYLHCDPTASHYLKLLMDAVFEAKNFQNEVVWHYKRWPIEQKAFQRMHDIIFFYQKGDYKNRTFNTLFGERTESTLRRWKDKKIVAGYDNTGRRIPSVSKDEQSAGVPMDDIWDLSIIAPSAKERMGYPTQKPEALLERIIKASSNEGALVMDPFCGCGTTIAVAEKLNRKWIGIDITYLAIDVIKKRLEKHQIKENTHFKLYGDPKDVYSAGQLAEQAPFQFEVWAVSRLNATPTVKTGDKGVDGIINFIDHTKPGKIGKGIVSVKGGHSINPAMVRELKGTITSQNADFGILITTEKPTPGMIEEKGKAGTFDYSYQARPEDIQGTIQTKIPKIQLLTVGDLFTDPVPVKLPPGVIEPYRKPDIKKEAKGAGLF